jgi:hypothetical protein
MIGSTMRYFRWLRLAFLSGLVIFFESGCRQGRPALDQLPVEARTILLNTDELELYSLEPVEQGPGGEQSLHGWKVLGKTTLKNPKRTEELLAALNEGLGHNDGAKCFDPRHAIRASWEGKTVELVICFECFWVYVYLNGSAKETAQVEISRAPESTFNKFLTDAGLPLAKPRN